MKLSPPFLENLCFTFSTAEELLHSLGESITDEESLHIKSLAADGLPPITSPRVLAAMIGVNEGLIWSMNNRQSRHYRTFSIPKGSGQRTITAPRVALKIIQKWLSIRLQAIYQPPPHVFGFVPGMSHIDAAACHLNARWVFNFDIQNFFPTTSEQLVSSSLQQFGFNEAGAGLISRLACYHRNLAQGSPTSPVLSNICFSSIDAQLNVIATAHNLRLSRYADDIVFSGVEQVPITLRDEVMALFRDTPWRLAQQKTHLAALPSRLKVHGLLVHGDEVRLTKGYRNKIRAFRHLQETGHIRSEDSLRIRGHLSYAASVTSRS